MVGSDLFLVKSIADLPDGEEVVRRNSHPQFSPRGATITSLLCILKRGTHRWSIRLPTSCKGLLLGLSFFGCWEKKGDEGFRRGSVVPKSWDTMENRIYRVRAGLEEPQVGQTEAMDALAARPGDRSATHGPAKEESKHCCKSFYILQECPRKTLEG